MTCDEAKTEIAYLLEHAVGLTDWEAEFLRSRAEKLEQYGDEPSPKQIAVLDKIRRERLP